MARQLYGKKRAASAAGRAKGMQKAGTEESLTRASRNKEMNRMAREQEDAKKQGMFEGNWMKALGTIVAIGAVMAVTGGFGGAALLSAGSASAAGAGTVASGFWGALGIGAMSAGGTYAGMKLGDARFSGEKDPAAMMTASGKIDQSALHRGTVGGNYGTMFDPLNTLSKQGDTMASTYGAQKDQGYIFAPLTSGVTASSGNLLAGLKG